MAEPSNLGAELYQARAEFLIRLHQEVWRAGYRFILPTVVLVYCYGAWKLPCWQTGLLAAGTLAMCVAWFAGARRARRGDLQGCVRYFAVSAISFITAVALLRENSAITSAIALFAFYTYVSLFSHRALRSTVAVSAPLFAGALLAGHFHWLPQYAQSAGRELVQTLLYIAVFFPIITYFLRSNQRINEALFAEAQAAGLRNEQVVQAIARVQPELDRAISGLRPVVESFSASAARQASTSAQMGTSAHTITRRVAETAEAAGEARQVAERVRVDASLGREKLRALEGSFQIAVSRIDSVRAQIDELAGEVAMTEEINTAIQEIAESLAVLGINASLEAAKSGEHGRGFGVVAQALQRMVGQTNVDLQRANQILEHLRERAAVIAQDADASTGELRRSYDELVAVAALLEAITTNFGEASRAVETIAGAAEQQRAGVSEIGSGIQEMVQVASQFAEAGKGVSDGLGRVEGAHRQLRDVLLGG